MMGLLVCVLALVSLSAASQPPKSDTVETYIALKVDRPKLEVELMNKDPLCVSWTGLECSRFQLHN
jgi:hypothetical protein